MDNLVLVGFSLSGKTTVGRMLARRLRLQFVDTDKLVEQAAGRLIPEIFRDDGEAAFRALEREAVAEVCARRFQVISTGGGAFVDARNRDTLRNGNLVIHLRIQPRTVLERLRSSKSGRPRPLLEHPDPLKRIVQLMSARHHAYSQAHISIDVDGRATYDLTADLVRQWFDWRRVRRGADRGRRGLVGNDEEGQRASAPAEADADAAVARTQRA